MTSINIQKLISSILVLILTMVFTITPIVFFNKISSKMLKNSSKKHRFKTFARGLNWFAGKLTGDVDDDDDYYYYY